LVAYFKRILFIYKSVYDLELTLLLIPELLKLYVSAVFL